MENQKQFSQLMAIFGTGRSGSSWLGSIVDSHPKVAYPFEPFHRLKLEPVIARARQLLESDHLTDADLPGVYDVLLPTDSRLERPPFFHKDYATTRGKDWLRPLAQVCRPLQPLFTWLYSARQRPPLVFKEVTMEEMMANLLAKTSMPVIYLVRHPGGVVSSSVIGQRQGVMPTGRHSVLASLLEKHDSELAARHVPYLDKMDFMEKEALLWRINVEKGVRAVRNHPNALLVIYERLCDDPLAAAKQVFQHFGLDFSQQTAQFIERLYQEGSSALREVGIKSYFSVVRNPAAMKDKWKQELSADNQQRILRLVQDSAAFQWCATLGKWG